MKFICTLAVAMLLFFASCDTAPKYDPALLKGTWKCVKLYSDGAENLNPQTIIFSFRPDSTYDYTGGSYTETGKWWLEGDKLVTAAENNLEKKVQLNHVTADSVVMTMNDRGTELKLILLPQH